MKINDREKKALDEFTFEGKFITDVGEAVAGLIAYGDEFEFCMHPSIRKEAYEKFIERKAKN
jgi:hypothetical protein